MFVIEPLDRGFGYTFGNSLRRVLLSSLEGAAVTSVKIEGVAHEFTTLPGVREDVTDILLNLKQLVCVLHGESPEVEVRLSASGEGTVPPPTSRCRPTSRSSTPSSRSQTSRPRAGSRSRSRSAAAAATCPAEGNRGQAHTIGVIPVDSMFSPVRRVAYDVEAARVGQRTDYDKLILDVTTNGSIDPKDAIAQAAEILIRQLAIFTDLEQDRGLRQVDAPQLEGGAMVDVSLAHGMENFPIEELELGVRSYNCLKRVGIETIGDLVTKTRERARLDPELRQEVDRGGQGDARPARSAAARRQRKPRRSRAPCVTSAPARSWAVTRPIARRSTRTSPVR